MEVTTFRATAFVVSAISYVSQSPTQKSSCRYSGPLHLADGAWATAGAAFNASTPSITAQRRQVLSSMCPRLELNLPGAYAWQGTGARRIRTWNRCILAG